jgi:hypothetical protein
METITTSGNSEFSAGDNIAIVLPDRRWWRRLWHFVTFQSSPTITKYATVSGISLNEISISSDSGRER